MAEMKFSAARASGAPGATGKFKPTGAGSIVEKTG